ncbi:MAG: DinB family protein [Bacteroidia bacterium]|nr:DinB family protein [Bacteroidia bacterium]MBT8277774.1 DinB family protein [Bacteroidia bacterium]NNK61457.1 DinB family protein [Flavobacteriaceae bacterium]
MNYSIAKALPILERTPEVLSTLLIDLDDDWIYSNEGPDTWSPFDIVGHLIHGEITDWTSRLNIILSEADDKTFEPFDRFAQFETSKLKNLTQLLAEFKTRRAENIKYLKSLNITKDQFDLKAVHPSLGEVTMKELLSTWVAHDLGHIAQIARVMAKQYKDEVGPWQEYMPILNR